MIAQPVRQALDFGARPDPAKGIFETIRVTDGVAPLLGAQLERLRASALELYGIELAQQLAGVLDAAPEGSERLLNEVPEGSRRLLNEVPEGSRRLLNEVPEGSGRLRAVFVPGHGLQVERGARPADPVYTEVAPFVLPGGLGPHKWLDRTLLDAVTVAAGERALPLLLDADGAVLEATRMNVLIEERGRLISPPSDGRFRPGFGRSGLRYDEEPVDLDRLLAADAVVLTSALRTVRMPLTA